MQWDLDEEKLAWTNTGCSKWKWIIENYMFFRKNGCLLYSYDVYLLNINSYQFVLRLELKDRYITNISNQWNIGLIISRVAFLLQIVYLSFPCSRGRVSRFIVQHIKGTHWDGHERISVFISKRSNTKNNFHVSLSVLASEMVISKLSVIIGLQNNKRALRNRLGYLKFE